MIGRTYLWVVLAALGLTGPDAASAYESSGAGPLATQVRTFTARTVSLRGLSARLSVGTHAGKEVRLRLSGTRDRMRRVTARVTDGALEINDDVRRGVAHSSVRVENSVVITEEGGTSTVIIGGTPMESAPAAEELTVYLTVPRGVPVAIEDYAGDAEIADLAAPFSLHLLSGKARIGRLTNARLMIAGSGEISVRRIDGALDMSIDGAGEIAIADGKIPSLSLATDGAARVTVGGRVGRARMTLDGIADVHVDRMDERPVVDAEGVVDITIGNW